MHGLSDLHGGSPFVGDARFAHGHLCPPPNVGPVLSYSFEARLPTASCGIVMARRAPQLTLPSGGTGRSAWPSSRFSRCGSATPVNYPVVDAWRSAASVRPFCHDGVQFGGLCLR